MMKRKKSRKTPKVNHGKEKTHYQPQRNHKFSVEFVRATIYLYHVFHEIDQAPLIAWFEEFDRSQDPEKELQKWIHMANCFQLLTQEEQKNLEKHKRIYKTLLDISAGITLEKILSHPDFNQKGLSEQEVQKIYDTYTSIR